jgi:hypothetical protein
MVRYANGIQIPDKLVRFSNGQLAFLCNVVLKPVRFLNGLKTRYIQWTSKYRTLFGFQIRSYASTIFQRASLGRLIKKRVIKNILFILKWSRLEVKKTSVRFWNGPPSCFDHPKTGLIRPVFEWLKQDGCQSFLTSSLDCFVMNKIKIFFMTLFYKTV